MPEWEYQNATEEEKAVYEKGWWAFHFGSIRKLHPSERFQEMSGPHRKWFIRGWRNANKTSREAWNKSHPQK